MIEEKCRNRGVDVVDVNIAGEFRVQGEVELDDLDDEWYRYTKKKKSAPPAGSRAEIPH
jgi:hypothetical protein